MAVPSRAVDFVGLMSRMSPIQIYLAPYSCAASPATLASADSFVPLPPSLVSLAKFPGVSFHSPDLAPGRIHPFGQGPLRDPPQGGAAALRVGPQHPQWHPPLLSSPEGRVVSTGPGFSCRAASRSILLFIHESLSAFPFLSPMFRPIFPHAMRSPLSSTPLF